MSLLLRLSISFCSRHCCTLVLAPSISSSSGSRSSVQKRESHIVLCLVRAGNHFFFPSLSSQHHTLSVCLYCLSPSLFSSQHHGHHAGADGATCAESSKVAGSDAGAIGSRRQRLHQRCHPFAGSFNSSYHCDY